MGNFTPNRIIAAISLVLILTIQSKIEAQVVKLEWINFGPYTEVGQNPTQLDSVSEAQIIALLDSLQPWVKGIRTFGTRHGLQNIPSLAKDRGFKVIVGIWLGEEDTQAGFAANQKQMANGIALANAGLADKLIVGSEVMLRGDLPPSRLVEYIEAVQLACPTVPVSCADVAFTLIANPEVANACDFVAVNIYPFWAGCLIDCAMQCFHQSYLDLLPITNGKEVFVSESGWKTTGDIVGDAIPSFENASRYHRELSGWSQAFNVDINIFSAFDEPWKLPNDDGWGIFFNDGTMKPGMEILFTPLVVIDSTWLCYALNNFSVDTLYTDFIPPIGSFSNLRGHIDHFKPCDYSIATYIKVGNGWWSKPTLAQPSVPLLCDGTWSIDFTTGGNDHLATDICVFIVPSGYTPPPCSGCPSVPLAVYTNAVDWQCIQRYQLPLASIQASSDTTCLGDTITLIATGGNQYLWNTGATTNTITVIPGQEPTATYTVEISDGMGGGTILLKTIFVIDIDLSVLDETVCVGDSAVLTAMVNALVNIEDFTWSNGETTQTITVFPDLLITNYSVTVTTPQGCSATYLATVYIQESYIISSEDTITAGEQVSLSSWGVSYLWSTGATTASIFVTPDSTSIYSVTVTTDAGCVNVLYDTIVVLPSVGVDDIGNSITFNFYPNPSNGTFVIKGSMNDSGRVRVSILNEQGYLLEERVEEPKNGELELHFQRFFLPGVYFVKLTTESGRFFIEKVIIQ